MTIWELKNLAEQKIKDMELTEQERNAWQNALNGVMEQIKLFDELKEELNYHQIVWHDGQRYQLYGSKQELYGFLYELRKKL